ncbi:cytochrome P450 [Cyathus striatus]|nr:cytochrome P450 [Cyathus striatus]
MFYNLNDHLLTLVGGIILCLVYWSMIGRSSRRAALPPGPKGLPIIGNMLDIPVEKSWLILRALSHRYNSDIIHINMLGQSTVILDSIEAATEILQKHSAKSSSRPNMPMINELIGYKWHFGFMPYGQEWRDLRKICHQEIELPAGTMHYETATAASRRFLVKMLDNPRGFWQQVEYIPVLFIIFVCYGIVVSDENDPLIQDARVAMNAMAASGTANAFMVDNLPLLRYLWDWLPGTDFKRKAKYWEQYVAKMPESAFGAMLKVQSKSKEAVYPSLCSRALDRFDNKEHIKNTAAAIYAGGTDTTTSALQTFVLAMLQFPDIQRKGQDAVDAATFGKRLPNDSDMGAIPYVDAIVLEVFRWKPVVPLTTPHASTEDVYYKDYLIPAGTTLVANAWSILYDESEYGPDVNVFNPERFLKDGEINQSIRDPRNAAFGFGRRECPGRTIATALLWNTVASFLAVFNIVKAEDEKGNIKEPSGEYTSGLMSFPVPFESRFLPRSLDAENLVKEGLMYL